MEKCFEEVSYFSHDFFLMSFQEGCAVSLSVLKRSKVTGNANSFLNLYHIEEKQWVNSFAWWSLVSRRFMTQLGLTLTCTVVWQK
jgi:hypothetical protein